MIVYLGQLYVCVCRVHTVYHIYQPQSQTKRSRTSLNVRGSPPSVGL